jgi:hypothetical protein
MSTDLTPRRWLWAVLVLSFVVSLRADPIPFARSTLSDRSTFSEYSNYLGADPFLGGNGLPLTSLRSSLFAHHEDVLPIPIVFLSLPFRSQSYRVRLLASRPARRDTILQMFLKLFAKLVLANRGPCADGCTRYCEYSHGCTAFQDRPQRRD